MKTLIFDIEISPNLTWTYDPYDARIIDIEQNQFILSVAYKWLGEKKIHVVALPDFPLYKRDKTNDREVLKVLWNLLDKCQICCGHNIRQFDIKKTNARFVYHKMSAPSPYATIDTLTVARSKFSYPGGNALSALAEFYQLDEKKLHIDSHTWLAAIKGDMDAWKQIKIYNKRDVNVTEKIYLLQRPFMTNHANMGVENGGCPSCGSERIQKRGTRETQIGIRQLFWCRDCDSWSRSAKTIVTTDIRP